jgi:hypothetical protein
LNAEINEEELRDQRQEQIAQNHPGPGGHRTAGMPQSHHPTPHPQGKFSNGQNRDHGRGDRCAENRRPAQQNKNSTAPIIKRPGNKQRTKRIGGDCNRDASGTGAEVEHARFGTVRENRKRREINDPVEKASQKHPCLASSEPERQPRSNQIASDERWEKK